MQSVTDAKTLARWREGCILYARADRSDPFALARALTHLRTGIVSYYQPLPYPGPPPWGQFLRERTRFLQPRTESLGIQP